MTMLDVSETKVAFDQIRNQIKNLEASIMTIHKNGSAPLGISVEIGIGVASTIETLKQARGQIESLICLFDN